MAEHQAALSTLMEQRSMEAMAALRAEEKAGPISASQAAAVGAAMRSAAGRRSAAEELLMTEKAVLDGKTPMDIWMEADKAPTSKSPRSSPRRGGDKGGVERRVRTFVGLNFVR